MTHEQGRQHVKRTHAWTALALVGALALGACGSDSDSTSDSSSATTAVPGASTSFTVTVSSGNFPESQLLAEIYAQSLEQAGIRVARKDSIGAREAYYAAIKAGEVSLIPEYTNSLLSYVQNKEGVTATLPPTTVADTTVDTASADTTAATTGDTTSDTATDGSVPEESNGPTIEQQVAMIKSILPSNLTVGDPSTAEDKDVIVCGSAVAEKYSLKTLSDLAKVADQITLGAPPEFETRTPFGLVGFKDILGAEFKKFVPLDIGAVADSIKSGAIDCGNLFSTMSVILTEGFIPLEDDKTLVAHEAVLPLLTTDAATPEVLDALNQVSAGLTTDVLKSLMVKIEVDKLSADEVAKNYLASVSQSAG